LFLREIRDVTGHRSCDDEGAGAAGLEVCADGFGTVEGAGEIGLNDFVPGVDGAIKDTCVILLAFIPAR
jgi:hypothetical protein